MSVCRRALSAILLLAGFLSMASLTFAFKHSPLDAQQCEFLLHYAQWREQREHTDAPAPQPSQSISQVDLHLHLSYLLRYAPITTAHQDRLALRACLLYMYDDDIETARNSIDALHVWAHSEHFLEYRPALLLDVLDELQWPVREDRLRMAMGKLERLLPSGEHDMIDCAAGKPLGQLLNLLVQQLGSTCLEDIERYRRSPDPYLSYAAQLIMLRLRHSPAPTIKQLVEQHWRIHTRADLAQLSPQQRLLAECIAAHEGAMDGSFVPWLDVALLVDIAEYWRVSGYSQHAEALLAYLTTDHQAINQDPDHLHRARDRYRNIEKKSPLAHVADALLQHADLLLPPAIDPPSPPTPPPHTRDAHIIVPSL